MGGKGKVSTGDGPVIGDCFLLMGKEGEGDHILWHRGGNTSVPLREEKESSFGCIKGGKGGGSIFCGGRS